MTNLSPSPTPDKPPYHTTPSQCPGIGTNDPGPKVPHAATRGKVWTHKTLEELQTEIKTKFADPQRTFHKLALAEGGDRRTYAATFIQSGMVQTRDHSQSHWLIPADAVQAAADLFNNRAVFCDHPDDGLFTSGYPSMRDLVGVTQNATYNEDTQSIDGEILMYEHVAADWLIQLMDQIVADQANGLPTPDVGISIVFFGTHEWDADLSPPAKVTKSIEYVESCDIVFGPAAAGRIHTILSMAGGNPMPEEPITQEPTTQPAVVDPASVRGAEDPASLHGTLAATIAPPTPPAAPAAVGAGLVLAPSTPAPDAGLATLSQQMTDMHAQVEKLTQALASSLEPNVVRGMGNPPSDPPKSPRIGDMFAPIDQITLAYEKLMGLPVSQEVYPLTGIRELYMLLTGDRRLIGKFTHEQLANTGYDGSGNNADTSSMAEITRNVMNKALIEQADLLAEYRWWQNICHIEDFNTLNQVSWVRTGGIGDIPTVEEKGEYTQLAWDDARVAADWVKKGGYLPLSLEMIDRDDTAAWRTVPQQLATSAEVTLSSVVSALFTDNSGIGPSITTEGSTDNAFSSTWGNLITQPLDYDNWGVAIQTMYELAQLNVSGRAQGIRPKFLLVPIELEADAIAAATSDRRPGTNYNDRVPVKRMLPEENVITVPHWTDAESWAAVADPRLCPFAGVGFRFGRTPELFTAGDPNTHLLFTNDVLPIKVRWLFAVSVIDPRGAIKSNA